MQYGYIGKFSDIETKIGFEYAMFVPEIHYLAYKKINGGLDFIRLVCDVDKDADKTAVSWHGNNSSLYQENDIKAMSRLLSQI